jgi:co-chaperonin GroES (HSP10)
VKKTQGGIILPNMENSPQAYGRVVSIGPEVTGVEVGDVLTYWSSAAKAIYLKKRHFDVMPFDDVYGKITDEEIISELDLFGSKADEMVRPVAGGGSGTPHPLIKTV